MIRSLLSALTGQFTCILVVFCMHPSVFADASLGAVFIILLYSAQAILPVWLLLLWPLYRLVPRSSVLWRPYICVPCGLLAGLLLASLWCRVTSGSWDFRHFISWGLGPLVGAATCAAGCALKAYEPAVHGPPAA